MRTRPAAGVHNPLLNDNTPNLGWGCPYFWRSQYKRMATDPYDYHHPDYEYYEEIEAVLIAAPGTAETEKVRDLLDKNGIDYDYRPDPLRAFPYLQETLDGTEASGHKRIQTVINKILTDRKHRN